MPYNLVISQSAEAFLATLSVDQGFDFSEKAEAIMRAAPTFGRPLQDMADRNLAGCLKVYFDNASLRIVYEVIENDAIIHAIGPREGMGVYISADQERRKLYQERANLDKEKP